MPEKAPKEEHRGAEQKEIIDEAELRGLEEKLKPLAEHPLDLPHEHGEHHQIEGEEHPSPPKFRGGELGPPLAPA